MPAPGEGRGVMSQRMKMLWRGVFRAYTSFWKIEDASDLWKRFWDQKGKELLTAYPLAEDCTRAENRAWSEKVLPVIRDWFLWTGSEEAMAKHPEHPKFWAPSPDGKPVLWI